MIRPDELPNLAANLERIAKEKLGILMRYSPPEKDDLFDIKAEWSITLRKGNFTNPRFEIIGRSEKSFSDALDNALRELDSAGAIGARLEPAAHGEY